MFSMAAQQARSPPTPLSSNGSSVGEDDIPPPPSHAIGPVSFPQTKPDQNAKEWTASSFFSASSSGRCRLFSLVLVLVVIVIAATAAALLVRRAGTTEPSSSLESNLANQNSLRASATASTAPSAASFTPPTVDPSPSPSTTPTALASEGPSLSPTNAPTRDDLIVEPNPVPSNPDRSYFNYNTTDKDYGPDVWDDVDTRDNYLVEFGDDGFGPFKGHFSRDPSKNRCGRDGKMSPVDLYQTDIDESKCDAGHQIRTRVRECCCD